MSNPTGLPTYLQSLEGTYYLQSPQNQLIPVATVWEVWKWVSNSTWGGPCHFPILQSRQYQPITSDSQALQVFQRVVAGNEIPRGPVVDLSIDYSDLYCEETLPPESPPIAEPNPFEVRDPLDPKFLRYFSSSERRSQARASFAGKPLQHSDEIVFDPRYEKELKEYGELFWFLCSLENEFANIKNLHADLIHQAKNIENRRGYELRQVEGIGFGVFARKEYEENQVIDLFAGILTKEVIDPDYAFGLQGFFAGFSIDASVRGNCMRFLNHNSGEDANVIACEYFDFEKQMPYVVLIAQRKICIGEQLTCDYGSGYWEGKGPPKRLS